MQTTLNIQEPKDMKSVCPLGYSGIAVVDYEQQAAVNGESRKY